MNAARCDVAALSLPAPRSGRPLRRRWRRAGVVALVLLGHARLLGTLPGRGGGSRDRAGAAAARLAVGAVAPVARAAAACRAGGTTGTGRDSGPAGGIRAQCRAGTAVFDRDHAAPPGPPAALPADGRAVSWYVPACPEPVSDSMARGTDPLRENLARVPASARGTLCGAPPMRPRRHHQRGCRRGRGRAYERL